MFGGDVLSRLAGYGIRKLGATMKVEKVTAWNFQFNERETRALGPIVNVFLDSYAPNTYPESWELATRLKEVL